MVGGLLQQPAQVDPEGGKVGPEEVRGTARNREHLGHDVLDVSLEDLTSPYADHPDRAEAALARTSGSPEGLQWASTPRPARRASPR